MKKIKVLVNCSDDTDLRNEVDTIEEFFTDIGYDKADFCIVWSEVE